MNLKQVTVDDDTNIVQKIIFKYLPFWYWFLILFAISGALAYFYLDGSIPIYESSASILIQDEKKGQENSKMEEVLDLFNSKKIVENELEILHSNAIISMVVKDLKLYAPILQEKGWKGRKISSAYITCPVVLEFADPETLKEVGKVYFTFSNEKNAVTISGTDYPLNQLISSPWGLMRFVRNKNYRPDVNLKPGERVNYYFSLVNVTKQAGAIAGGLVAAPTNKQSSVISLKIRDAIPIRGEAIIMGVINAYNLNAVTKKNAVAASTLQFIDDRLKHVSGELDSVEGSIQKYRNRAGIVDISEQGRLYLQSMQENDKKRNELKVQAASLDEVQKYLDAKSSNGSSLVPSTVSISDPVLTQLISKLSTSESEYEKLKKTTGAANPILTSLQNDIAKTKSDVLETIKSQKNNLTAAQTSLDEVSNKYSSMVSSIPQKERELVDVSRQRNSKADNYAFLLQKREETVLALSSNTPDSYIVDVATTNPNPVAPKKLFIIIVAGMVPLVMGAALISLKEIFNNSILFRADIEKLTKFPVVGEIVHSKFSNPIVTASPDRSFVIEQFRLIRSTLRNMSEPQGTIKRIVVSSSIEGEGKSFIAANLANTFARSGKKTALLEMDLHQPRICEMFEIDRGKGITDYLQGAVNEADIVLQSTVQSNLYILSAGNIVPDASELLLNGKLEKLIAYLDKEFDIIVIDCAPINPITDLYTIAPLCDFVLYVVRHSKTPKVQIKHLDETMDSHNISKLAIIFNGVKSRGSGKYSYGYGYGYGFDYRSSYDSYINKKAKKEA